MHRLIVRSGTPREEWKQSISDTLSLAGVLTVTAAVALVGCGGGSSVTEDVPSSRLVNPALGVTLASVPPSFQVAVNRGAELVLTPSEATRSGRLEFGVEDPTGGVNLVSAVQRHRERFEALADGEYKGAQELVTPLGSAFWSRGRLPADGGLSEEARVMAVHPSGTRLLTLTYTYPAGNDTSARAEELLAVLGEIEPGQG